MAKECPPHASHLVSFNRCLPSNTTEIRFFTMCSHQCWVSNYWTIWQIQGSFDGSNSRLSNFKTCQETQYLASILPDKLFDTFSSTNCAENGARTQMKVYLNFHHVMWPWWGMTNRSDVKYVFPRCPAKHKDQQSLLYCSLTLLDVTFPSTAIHAPFSSSLSTHHCELYIQILTCLQEIVTSHTKLIWTSNFPNLTASQHKNVAFLLREPQLSSAQATLLQLGASFFQLFCNHSLGLLLPWDPVQCHLTFYLIVNSPVWVMHQNFLPRAIAVPHCFQTSVPVQHLEYRHQVLEFQHCAAFVGFQHKLECSHTSVWAVGQIHLEYSSLLRNLCLCSLCFFHSLVDELVCDFSADHVGIVVTFWSISISNLMLFMSHLSKTHRKS